jgi:predicted metal-binding protein
MGGEYAMKKLSKYLSMALKKGMTDAIVVETSRVYTAPWVRMKCQFGCRRYGQSHCCPPHTPSPDEMRKILDSYSRAILLHRNWGADVLPAGGFNEVMLELERTIFLDGYYKAWSVGSGPCTMCKTCSITGACLHSALARPSMESCGIDVFKTAREQGLPIKVLKSKNEERQSYGLLLVE